MKCLRHPRPPLIVVIGLCIIHMIYGDAGRSESRVGVTPVPILEKIILRSRGSQRPEPVNPGAILNSGETCGGQIAADIYGSNESQKYPAPGIEECRAESPAVAVPTAIGH